MTFCKTVYSEEVIGGGQAYLQNGDKQNTEHLTGTCTRSVEENILILRKRGHKCVFLEKMSILMSFKYCKGGINVSDRFQYLVT